MRRNTARKIAKSRKEVLENAMAELLGREAQVHKIAETTPVALPVFFL
jgi:hypothetical protein